MEAHANNSFTLECVNFSRRIKEATFLKALRAHASIPTARKKLETLGLSNQYPGVNDYRALALELDSRGFTPTCGGRCYLDTTNAPCIVLDFYDNSDRDVIVRWASEYGLKPLIYTNPYPNKVLIRDDMPTISRPIVMILRVPPKTSTAS